MNKATLRALAAFTVLLLGVFPSISPGERWAQPAQAAGEEIDRYYTFDGVDDVATDGFNLASNYDFSIEMWLYFEGTSEDLYGIFRFGDGTDSNKRRAFAYVYRDANGQNSLKVGVNGTSSHFDSGYDLPDHEWVHLALVRENSNDWRIDINGTEVYRQSTAYWNLGGSPTPFRLGDEDSGGSHWKGRIDQVKIWDGALTSSQVKTSMNTWDDTGITGKSLLHHYDFNDASTTQVDDQEGTDDLAWTGSPVSDSFRDVKTSATSGSNMVFTFPRSYLTATGGWTIPAGISEIDYLLVGGGGSGGSTSVGSAGGGGGAQVSEVSNVSVTASSVVAVTVGSGGIPRQHSGQTIPTGSDGGSTSLIGTGIEVSVLGGSAGANAWLYTAPQATASSTGFSGGGGSSHAGTASLGSTGVGDSPYKGGDAWGDPGVDNPQAGGGGGGAGGSGADARSGAAGDGGVGVPSSITGTTTSYGGGGGGGKRTSSGSAGAGGSGGGGAGGKVAAGTNGSANTGGGGGGAGANALGGFGGSGLVVVFARSFSLTLDNEGAQATQTVVVGNNPSDPGTTRTGYALSGWSDADDDSAEYAADLSDYTMGAADDTLYAVWVGPLLVYEPFTGTNGTNLSGASSSGSQGFAGPWETVQSTKHTGQPAQSHLFQSSSALALPSNTGFQLPSGNTAISGSTYILRNSARELSVPVSFDRDGTYFMSYVMHVPANSGSWGDAMVGFASDLPTSSADTTPWSLLAGSIYFGEGLFGIDYGNANEATWVPDQTRGATASTSAYSAVGTKVSVGTTPETAHFVLVKIETSASGSDQVSLRAFAPLEDLPADASSITWDVTYSTPIYGSANYIAVESEAGGLVDEIRLGLTYDSVANPLTTFTIQLEAGDSGTGSSQTLTKSFRVDLALPDSETANGYFTRTGYRVTGWATNSDGTGTTFALGASYSTEAADTLYPVWTYNNYTVSFQAGDNGSGSNRSSTKIHGTALTLPDSETANSYFTRAGYGIVGWSESADGSTADYALGGSYTANAGDTLYPVWELNSCVVNSGDTYVNSGGGSAAVYGSGSTMIFKNASSSTSNSYNRAGYLRFEYDPSVTWDGATLQVTVNTNSTGGTNSFYNGSNNFQVKVYAVGAADWDESTLTFNSANASTADWGLNTGTFPWTVDNGTLLGTIDIPTSTSAIGVSYGLSNDALDAFLNADSDGEVTFFLVRTDTQSQPNLGFATRDQTTYSAPTLLPHPASCAYTITFNKGSASGAGGSDNTATKIQGTGLTLPDSTTANNYFTRIGYSVSGWATSADGTGTTYAFSALYTADRGQTLYPVWTPDTYTVTYDYDNATAGNSASSADYTVDSVAISLPTPTKTGYTLDGWYDASSGGNLVGAGGASYTPSANITIYAQWSAATFTVVYDYNGATGITTTDDDFTTGSGSPITLPTPTRTGFTFEGWYSDAALTSPVGAAGASYSPSVNLTVYAKWTAVSRGVTYMGTNKTSGSVPTDSASYIIGNSVVVKANSGGLVRTGYDFAGWTENSDGSGTVLEAGDTVTVQTSDITLYAKWTAATYTITYHANGGSGTLARATDTHTTGDSGVTLPGAGSLAKTGYDFGGWSTTPTGSALVGAYSTSQNRTLYAVWSIKSITYSYATGSDGDGNSLSSFGFSATFPTGSMDDFGTSVTLSSSVDASIDADANGSVDHQFFGWSDGTTVYDAGDTYVLGETDPTFTAQWIKVYSVRYALAGGTFAGSDQETDSQCLGDGNTCNDGQVISLNSRPSRAGYSFLGWEDQSAVVRSAASLATITSTSYLFTAKWDPIDYTLNFNSLGGSNVISDYTQNIGDIVTIPDPGSKAGYSFGGWSDGSTLYGTGTTYTLGASGASFSAQWIPDIYTVTYDWQGGSSSTPNVSDAYTVGTGDMSLATASGSGYTRDGYTFSGWATSAGGGVVSGFRPTADDVLYAVWADGNYTLSYDGQGGTVGSGLGTVPRTTSVTLPTPVRSNFTFVGWYDASSGGNLLGAGGASFTPTSSQSLYARWVQDSLYGVDLATLETANTYTASDSTSTDTTISHTPSSSSARVQIPAGALPAGTVVTVRYFKDTERATDLISDENTYFFSLLVSWLYGSGSSATVPDTAAGKPITVTLTNSNIKAGAMVYQVIGETVTELARATVDGSVTVELTEDPEVVVAATKPSAPTSVSGTSGDTRVSVSWTAGSSGGSPITGYTVTASPGGAQCSTASTACTINSLTNNTAYTFTVTAYNALGESTASTASSGVTPVGSNYAVTFDANGGSSVSASSFFSGSSVSAPTSPSRSGYTFEGWSTTLDDDTTEVTFPYSPGVTNAITLFALWEVAPPAPSSGGSGGVTVTPNAQNITSVPVLVIPRVLGPTQPVVPPRLFSAPVVISPQRGFDPDVGSQARVGGLPATVTKSAPAPGAVSVGVGSVEVGITPQNSPSALRPVAPVRPTDVAVSTGQSAVVAGGGLLPGSQLQVWLPGLTGSNPKELARIPVRADGTFESEVSFSARQSDIPVPIGRQVIQVTGFDESGNQTVVDLTISIGQGDPAPEVTRADNALPGLSPGQSLATSAGLPETVNIQARPEAREVSVISGEWSFTVGVPENSGEVEQVDAGATITLVQAQTATVSGDGFQPDTRVDIWLFSDPTLLGSVIVSADGSFTGEVYLDVRFAVPGEHTLQLQGVANDGFIKAANLGVVVEEPVVFTGESASGLLWWVAGGFLLLLLVVSFVIAARRRRAQTR